jgi:decaprenyl-phosphate phosphoribosyltransferase
MLVALLRAMRPHQWVKNLFVLAPLVFAKELLHVPMALRTLAGFALFSLAASTVYLLNDLNDVEADRAHPVKRHRPIASGLIPERLARNAAIGLAVVAIGGSLPLSPWLAACILGYLTLNLAYSKKLKSIAYLDVMCITAGFELRVFAGAFAADVPASWYLLVVTFLLATFLGFGKRMHELMQGEGATKQRSVLARYDRRTLTALLFLTALATVATYAVYTLDPHTREAFDTDYLIVTTAMPLFGVLRFLHLVRRRHEAESPTEDMLRDKPFLLNLLAWAGAVLVVIYVT